MKKEVEQLINTVNNIDIIEEDNKYYFVILLSGEPIKFLINEKNIIDLRKEFEEYNSKIEQEHQKELDKLEKNEYKKIFISFLKGILITNLIIVLCNSISLEMSLFYQNMLLLLLTSKPLYDLMKIICRKLELPEINFEFFESKEEKEVETKLGLVKIKKLLFELKKIELTNSQEEKVRKK